MQQKLIMLCNIAKNTGTHWYLHSAGKNGRACTKKKKSPSGLGRTQANLQVKRRKHKVSKASKRHSREFYSSRNENNSLRERSKKGTLFKSVSMGVTMVKKRLGCTIKPYPPRPVQTHPATLQQRRCALCYSVCVDVDVVVADGVNSHVLFFF